MIFISSQVHHRVSAINTHNMVSTRLGIEYMVPACMKEVLDALSGGFLDYLAKLLEVIVADMQS